MGIVFQSCFSFQLSIKLNEEDDHGILPLDLALKSKQEDLARNLVEHNVNIDQVDSNGSSLLHLAIDRGESNFRLKSMGLLRGYLQFTHYVIVLTDDTFSAMFLLDHGCQINGKRSFDNNTPLHLTAQHSSCVRVAQTLLDKGAFTNDTNLDGL